MSSAHFPKEIKNPIISEMTSVKGEKKLVAIKSMICCKIGFSEISRRLGIQIKNHGQSLMGLSKMSNFSTRSLGDQILKITWQSEPGPVKGHLLTKDRGRGM